MTLFLIFDIIFIEKKKQRKQRRNFNEKFIMIALATGTMLSFASCNFQLIDTTYTYDTAIISMFDGTTKEVKIKSWKDYDGEQLQITGEDGKVYLVSSTNCVLIKE